MRIDVLTLFPEMFEGCIRCEHSGQGAGKGDRGLYTVNFRDYSNNKHNTVDDYPYGGGGGMVLKPEPIFAAVEELMRLKDEGVDKSTPHPRRPASYSYVSARGALHPAESGGIGQEEHLVFICGHYEGYDERISEYLVTDEMSIGDYVLTGGELPAMVVIDSVVRLLPGVLGNEQSADNGFLQHRAAGISALYTSREVPRLGSAGDANFRTS